VGDPKPDPSQGIFGVEKGRLWCPPKGHIQQKIQQHPSDIWGLLKMGDPKNPSVSILKLSKIAKNGLDEKRGYLDFTKAPYFEQKLSSCDINAARNATQKKIKG
jgi:hypothetical protein